MPPRFQAPGILRDIQTFGRMVKFSHTIFAMPFALAAAALAAREGKLDAARILAIVAAMVFARTAAMGFNRIVDRKFDARNPRTADREIPSGQVSLRSAVLLTAGCALLFVATSAWLGPLCLLLSPVALGLICGYSYTKRFTWLCHVFLGLAIAAGPAGARIAVAGTLPTPALWLVLAVCTWIGGLDILYALADRDFDKSAGLNSIPSRFGLRGALYLSAALHLVTVVALVGVAVTAGTGLAFGIGVAGIAAVLLWEHIIVRPSDLSRLNVAFFTLNGYVSMVFLLTTVLDTLIRGS